MTTKDNRPNRSEDWIESRVLELAESAWDILPLARDPSEEGSPFIWHAARRPVLRAELDAAFLHLYGITRDDAEYILLSFSTAKRRDPDLTKRVLDTYDRITKAKGTGETFVSTLDPTPGHGPRYRQKS